MDNAQSSTEEKTALRRRCRQLRKSISSKARDAAARELSEIIHRRWPDHKILAYVAAGSEAPTQQVIESQWHAGRSVILPLVNGEGLTWHQVTSANDLTEGFRGIQEPKSSFPAIIPQEHQPWLCLVPGVAFTAAGKRLGQGGGFYDRALLKLRANGSQEGYVVGVAFACQMLGQLPTEAHDQHMDEVIVLRDGL